LLGAGADVSQRDETHDLRAVIAQPLQDVAAIDVRIKRCWQQRGKGGVAESASVKGLELLQSDLQRLQQGGQDRIRIDEARAQKIDEILVVDLRSPGEGLAIGDCRVKRVDRRSSRLTEVLRQRLEAGVGEAAILTAVQAEHLAAGRRAGTEDTQRIRQRGIPRLHEQTQRSKRHVEGQTVRIHFDLGLVVGRVRHVFRIGEQIGSLAVLAHVVAVERGQAAVDDEVLEDLVDQIDVGQRDVRILAAQKQILQIRSALEQDLLRIPLACGNKGNIDELQQLD